jgi:hypothetical protein
VSDHYIEKCKRCDGVIAQCRCASKDAKREIKTRLCDNCLNRDRLAATAIAAPPR